MDHTYHATGENEPEPSSARKRRRNFTPCDALSAALFLLMIYLPSYGSSSTESHSVHSASLLTRSASNTWSSSSVCSGSNSVTNNSGLRYCLNPNLKAVQRLMASIMKPKTSTTAGPAVH